MEWFGPHIWAIRRPDSVKSFVVWNRNIIDPDQPLYRATDRSTSFRRHLESALKISSVKVEK